VGRDAGGEAEAWRSDSRFTEDMIFALDVMQPATHAEQALLRRDVMFRFG
jgi:hypothetical protein